MILGIRVGIATLNSDSGGYNISYDMMSFFMIVIHSNFCQISKNIHFYEAVTYIEDRCTTDLSINAGQDDLFGAPV